MSASSAAAWRRDRRHAARRLRPRRHRRGISSAMRATISTRASARELKPIPGIAETLAALGVPCCVASSSQLERIRLSLDVTGLLDLLRAAYFQRHHGRNAASRRPTSSCMRPREMGVAPDRLPRHRGQPRRHHRGQAGGHAGLRLHRRLACRAAPACAPHFDRAAARTWSSTTCAICPTCSQANRRGASRRCMREASLVAVDVGTGSARAGIFDAARPSARPRRASDRHEPAAAPTTPSTIPRISGAPPAPRCAARWRNAGAAAARRSPASASTPPARWSCAIGDGAPAQRLDERRATAGTPSSGSTTARSPRPTTAPRPATRCSTISAASCRRRCRRRS